MSQDLLSEADAAYEVSLIATPELKRVARLLMEKDARLLFRFAYITGRQAGMEQALEMWRRTKHTAPRIEPPAGRVEHGGSA